MKIKFVFLIVFGCFLCFVYGTDRQLLPKDEVAELSCFFEKLTSAFNSKDVEWLKSKTGKSGRLWLLWLNGGEKLGKVEIAECSTRGVTNVTAKVGVVGGARGARSFDAVFTMRKLDGEYSIEDMSLPESDRLNRDFDASVDASKKLIAAINEGDLSKVQELILCEGAAELETELSERGLNWIKEAIDNRVTIPDTRMRVRRVGNKKLVGSVLVPCAPNGTNVLRQVLFKGSKIDREEPIIDYAAEARRTADENFRKLQKEESWRPLHPGDNGGVVNGRVFDTGK